MHSSNAGKVQSPVLQKPKLDPWSAGCQSQHCCLWKLGDISGNIWTAEQNALVTYGLQNKMLSNGTYVLQSEHPSDRQKGTVWTGPENSLALVASPWENVIRHVYHKHHLGGKFLGVIARPKSARFLPVPPSTLFRTEQCCQCCTSNLRELTNVIFPPRAARFFWSFNNMVISSAPYIFKPIFGMCFVRGTMSKLRMV